MSASAAGTPSQIAGTSSRIGGMSLEIAGTSSRIGGMSLESAGTSSQIAVAEPSKWAALVGALGFLVLAAALLAWAKWLPYLHKLHVASATGAYPGKDVLAKAGAGGSGPSLSGAIAFVEAYATAVWPALVAALAMAAAIEAFLSRRWLMALLGVGGSHGRLIAGVAALPAMMCTCCSAPIVRTLRRCGVPADAALAYWLGNPLLNPAVLAFLAIVLPWQWVATRAVVGGLLVFGLTGPLARLANRARPSASLPSGRTLPTSPASEATLTIPPQDGSALSEWPQDGSALSGSPQDRSRWPQCRSSPQDGSAPLRFGRALLLNGAAIVPEYLLVVLLVGLLRGWLLPLGHATVHLAALVTVLAALAGTLVVIPTGGEIPLIAALAAVGVGSGPLGALLIALPAISLPSMAMVGRTMGWRVTVAAAGAVAAAAVLAGALLSALSA